MKQTEITKQVGLKMVALAAALGFTFAAQGGIYTPFTDTPNQAIPDNNPSGVAYTFNFANAGLTSIEDVIVNFTVSGGRNGDLYAYLSHGSDALVLLNRVGVLNGPDGSQLYNYGYKGSGFNNITLSDSVSGLGNIHNYGGTTLPSVPTTGGTYKPDGQAVSPLTAPLNFSASGGSDTFNNKFFGDNPNGAWTLFFADVSGGSVSTVDNWNVGITAVPEPVNVALGIFGGVVAVVFLVRSKTVRALVRRWRAAAVGWIDVV